MECTNSQVKNFMKQVRRTVSELEAVAASYLRSYPSLKHLAKRPAVTYIVWSLLLSPLLALLLPMLLLGGSSVRPLLSVHMHFLHACAAA